MNEIERNIIKNSEYIIKYFEENNREVTNLMLEKLLYFLEAIYMSITDDNKLYNEDFMHGILDRLTIPYIINTKYLVNTQ